jgi:hypothetical protein
MEEKQRSDKVSNQKANNQKVSNLLVTGIIQVTGPHDTGKTRFALECGAHPKHTAFIDDDIKGRNTVEQATRDGIEFGHYVDFVERCKGKSLLEIHKAGMELVNSLPNNLDAIVWDTWTRFAATFKAYVTANPGEFRAPKEWPAMAQMKGATQWQESQLYEARVLSELLNKAKVVILVTHLKDHYGPGDKKTGAQIPASSRTLNRTPVMRLWLLHTSGSPVPSALVLKRVNRNKMTDRGLRTINILPRKIVPHLGGNSRPADESLWDTIAWYYDNPMGQRKPEAHETPTEKELAILDGTLTKEQRETLRWSLQIAAAELEKSELADQQAEIAELHARVKALHDDGNRPGKIAKTLGLKVPEVKSIIAQLEGDK